MARAGRERANSRLVLQWIEVKDAEDQDGEDEIAFTVNGNVVWTGSIPPGKFDINREIKFTDFVTIEVSEYEAADLPNPIIDMLDHNIHRASSKGTFRRSFGKSSKKSSYAYEYSYIIG